MIDLICSVSSCDEAELCLRYWARNENGNWNESLESISLDLKLCPLSLERRISELSVANVLHLRCIICGMPRTTATRARYDALQSLNDPTFLPCESPKCELSQRPINLGDTARLINKRIDFIENELQRVTEALIPIKLTSLDIFDSFYLYSVLLASRTDGREFQPPASIPHHRALAPTQILVNEVYNRLYRRGIIAPSLASPMASFNVTAAWNAPITYDVTTVCWNMAANDSDLNNNQLLIALETQLRSTPSGERIGLERSLCEHESLCFMIDSLKKSKFQSSTKLEKTLLPSVQCCLDKLSLKNTKKLIQKILNENGVARKIARINTDDVAKLASFLTSGIILELEQMTRSEIEFEDQSLSNKSILKRSKYIMPSVFGRDM